MIIQVGSQKYTYDGEVWTGEGFARAYLEELTREAVQLGGYAPGDEWLVLEHLEANLDLQVIEEPEVIHETGRVY